MSHEHWKARLLQKVEADGRKDRTISLAAGLGPNYVGQMRQPSKKGQRVHEILKLCRELRVSVTYIFTGVRMTPEEEEVVKIFSRLSDDQKTRLLDFCRTLPTNDSTPE